MKKQFLLSFILLGLVGMQNIAAAEEIPAVEKAGMWQSAKDAVTSETAKTLGSGAVITSVLALGTNYAVKKVKEKLPENKYLKMVNPKKAAMAVFALGAIITGVTVWRSAPKADEADKADDGEGSGNKDSDKADETSKDPKADETSKDPKADDAEGSE